MPAEVERLKKGHMVTDEYFNDSNRIFVKSAFQSVSTIKRSQTFMQQPLITTRTLRLPGDYDMLLDIADRSAGNELIGILITRPELPVGKEIVNSLNYYHHASGSSTNFYLPGYGAYWYGTYKDGRVVTKIDGVDWSYSDQMFVQFTEDLAVHSNWRYSGESELIMLEYRDNGLIFNQVMQFHLDNMIRDNVIPSISAFFQALFRMCKSDKSINKISNRFGKDKAIQQAKDTFLKKLPSLAKDVYVQEKYFCVKNCDPK